MEEQGAKPRQMDESERAAKTADRLRRARLLNGYANQAALSQKVGAAAANILIRAENEDRRLPTGATINLAADIYRVPTDYLYGRITCAESEDEQLMRIGLVHAMEGIGERLIRFLGNQVGHAASNYLESIQPLGLGTLLKHAEDVLALTSTMDLPKDVRFKFTQLNISVAEIKETRNERQQQIAAQITKAKKRTSR